MKNWDCSDDAHRETFGVQTCAGPVSADAVFFQKTILQVYF